MQKDEIRRSGWVIGALMLSLMLLNPLNAAAQAKTPEAKGGAVLRVVGPKSIYAKVGLVSNDQVVSIDETAIESAGEVGQLLYLKVGDGQEHRMRILREGREKVVHFK